MSNSFHPLAQINIAPLIDVGPEIASWQEALASKLTSMLVIGHGDLAKRQASSHELLLKQGVQIVYADISEASLSDALPGTKCFVIPRQESEMVAQARQFDGGQFDYLFINNPPRDHLSTALQYQALAKRIIIQKPQDLNYPLIETIAMGAGYESFRAKTHVHDHYRNKGVFPALLRVLPTELERHGRISRIACFITEAKNVNSERHRMGAIQCGMIQDLGVHLLDLVLETLANVHTWRTSPGGDETLRRVGGIVELLSAPKLVQQNSMLGERVETFSALDCRVTEFLQGPCDESGKPLVAGLPPQPHSFDILIALGKGVFMGQDVKEDLKAITVEYESGDHVTVCNLLTNSINDGPVMSEINQQHGGMNRPLMLLAPTPPQHATVGLGGIDYPQWQSLAFGMPIANLASEAKNADDGSIVSAYLYGRAVKDQVRDLAIKGKIRESWKDLDPATLGISGGRMIRNGEYFD